MQRRKIHNRLLLLTATLSALALAGCGEGGSGEGRERTERGGGLFTKKQVEQRGGYHFRVQASYTEKDTGKPLEFDYIVSCGSRTTHWRYTGPSSMVIVNPLVMIKPTSNGGAVLIRNPTLVCELGVDDEAYYGKTIPDDFMPFVIWFEDVNDLSFGWGYATEDAYHNANSKLSFHGATLTKSTYEDWKAWREQAERDYVQAGQMPGPWGYNYTQSPLAHIDWVKSLNDGKDITDNCMGYVSVPMPQEWIDKALAALPEDMPMPPDDARYVAVEGQYAGDLGDLLHEAGASFNGRRLGHYALNVNDAMSAIKRNNGGLVRTTHTQHKVFAPVYPLLPRSKSTTPLITAPADAYPMRLLVSDEWKGMLACGPVRVPGPDLVAKTKYDRENKRSITLRDESFDPDWKQKKYPLYINDELVAENTTARPYGSGEVHYFIIDRNGNIFFDRVQR